MLFKKKEPKYSSISSGETSKVNLVAFELKRLICFSAALCLVLSLISYFPTDPSWSTWSSHTSFQNWMGRFGSCLADLLFQLFGLCAFTFAVLPALFALRFPIRDASEKKGSLFGAVLLLISMSALLQAFLPRAWMPWGLQNPGGLTGQLASDLLTYVAGRIGSRIIATTLFLASVILTFRWRLLAHTASAAKKVGPFIAKAIQLCRERFPQWVAALKAKFRRKKSLLPVASYAPIAASSPVAETSAPVTETVTATPTPAAAEALPGLTIAEMVKPAPLQKIPKTRVHRGKYREYQLPNLNLLSGKAESKAKTVDKNWYLEKANILVQKLKDFGVDGEVVHISPGPVITVYEFKPASGVKIKEISNLSDDLTLALSVLSVRIVAPIPGKPVVGIEIPSPHREMVFFKDLLQETPFFKGDLKIPLVLGRLASGEPVAVDLAQMPHLLIAGSTGTGKSVFINTLISSFLYRFSPEQLKLILVDPKMVELSQFEGVPHLLLPVVVDSKKAVLALRWAVEEMERRYTLMHQFGVRHIDGYNERLAELQKEGGGEEFDSLPYIVVVIDEYADLMAVVPKDVELSIARLAQKARASGIHLVLATQRPSTDVVTGTIKANFPSRISFRVASSVDSKTILDRTGADRLLGHGDMLFHSAGFSTLRRIQGSYMADADTTRVVEYLKTQGEPEYDERILQPPEDSKSEHTPGGDDSEEGRLYDQAVALVTERGEASISLIQRHLKIGYNRAASLMEQLEKEGVVGESTGPAKRRAVLVNSI